jgi:hypothetical protein
MEMPDNTSTICSFFHPALIAASFEASFGSSMKRAEAGCLSENRIRRAIVIRVMLFIFGVCLFVCNVWVFGNRAWYLFEMPGLLKNSLSFLEELGF